MGERSVRLPYRLKLGARGRRTSAVVRHLECKSTSQLSSAATIISPHLPLALLNNAPLT